MKSDEPTENETTAPEGNDHDLLPPEPAVLESRVTDPEGKGQDWHICIDLIDPLADELEEWLSKQPHTAEDIESLRWFHVGIDGYGPTAYVNAWNRARLFLMLNTPDEFRRSFEDVVRGLAERAHNVLSELERIPLEGEDSQRRDITVFGFEVQVVERCLADLRNRSSELRRLHPAGSENRGGEVAVAPAQTLTPAAAATPAWKELTEARTVQPGCEQVAAVEPQATGSFLPRGKGSGPFFCQKLQEYVEKRREQYNRLVPAVMGGADVKEYQSIFGPIAVASAILREAGCDISDQKEKDRVDAAIKKCDFYKAEIQPVLSDPPRWPENWDAAEPRGGEASDLQKTMQQKAAAMRKRVRGDN